jgi:hypothetical protein
MSPKALFIVNAIIAVVFGLAFTLTPDKLLANYGTEIPGPGGTIVARLLGAALVSLALVSWGVRSTVDSAERDAVMLAFVIGKGIGLIISLMAVLGGAVNGLGWTTVALYLLLGQVSPTSALWKPHPDRAGVCLTPPPVVATLGFPSPVKRGRVSAG